MTNKFEIGKEYYSTIDNKFSVYSFQEAWFTPIYMGRSLKETICNYINNIHFIRNDFKVVNVIIHKYDQSSDLYRVKFLNFVDRKEYIDIFNKLILLK